MAFYRSFSTSRFLFLTVFALCVAFIHTETVAEASPTLHSDNQGTQSGDDGTDVGQVSTKEPHPDVTQPNHTVEYTDILDTMTKEEEEEEVVLGPGAITAIVIAVFLGASVLLALIVITLRKFTAS